MTNKHKFTYTIKKLNADGTYGEYVNSGHDEAYINEEAANMDFDCVVIHGELCEVARYTKA